MRLWFVAALVLVSAIGFMAAREYVAVPVEESWWSLEDPAATLSPNASPFTYETMLADLDAPRHASDGGGRAWLEHPARKADGSNPEIVAGSRARFEVIYEAGPLGVAEGGFVFLQVSPFWGWDTPQMDHPDLPGFTKVTTQADGIELLPEAFGQLLAIEIRGRRLEPGERIRFDFGAGSFGVRVDRYADRRERLWVMVDGDGDGVRGIVADSPEVDIVAGPPARLHIVGPATAMPGQVIEVAVSVLDAGGNAGAPFIGEIGLELEEGQGDHPARLAFVEGDAGSKTFEARLARPGVFRFIARAELGGGPAVSARSAPLIVRDDVRRVLWADLHGHSGLSDGTGTPDDYFAYARDVARLDVVALTDHDHWGVRFLDATPEYWREIQRSVDAFHDPPRFTTVLGYEWTSWLHGHRHVLAFGGDLEVLSSMSGETDTPRELWDALRGRSVLTFAHHSAGAPIATNWAFAPDPVLEPVTEIVSVHGSSEALDSPGLIRGPIAGNFVRDTLDHGYRFGFIGSGDSHDGHPGLVHFQAAPAHGGLAAILAEDNTREAVLDALRARRVYATNGARIWLNVELDGEPMGSVLKEPTRGREQQLRIEAVGTAPIAHVDIIRTGEVRRSTGSPGRYEWEVTESVHTLGAGDYVYVRVVQEDGRAAWSSPIYGVGPGQ
ncbi:MAG: CehA/McbA family metallohydrolase [Candidatus Binatia bacterium]